MHQCVFLPYLKQLGAAPFIVQAAVGSCCGGFKYPPAGFIKQPADPQLQGV